MRKLSSLILSVVLTVSLFAQKSPHGDSFTVSCADCHKTDGWKVDLKTLSFDHDSTKFPLVGQHRDVNCKDCHNSLEFAKTETGCNDCHADMHEQTVGLECARCHTPNSWVVSNITQLHQQSRFPLIGPHNVADCKDCHTNLIPATPVQGTASRLRFDPLGIQCYDCHKDNYLATTKPNHTSSQYSTNCTDCHNINAFEWAGAGINHNFFPLIGGHALSDCKQCHSSGVFSGLSNECYSCHQQDYTATINPNHISLDFPTNCKECHSLSPGWRPAEYKDHDGKSFPIYSGKHKGEWDNCSDCHTNPGNYSQFTCTNCHEHNKSDTDDEHDDVSGYNYNSDACYGCHPNGSSDGAFNHSSTNFPLTGAHASADCASCHANGYKGTTMVCYDCHTTNYNESINPNHTQIGISNDCAACHTTEPDWKPATFATHDEYYRLEGGHIPVANDCAACHKGNYVDSPNTCFGCHAPDYNQSNNPSHTAAQFPTTCEDCHSPAAWAPATFDHDGLYFPVYSGKHAGTWTNCNECHTTGGDFKQFSCIDCHDHNKPDMDLKHVGVGGYEYNSIACFTCHPDGTSLGFDHAAAGFPLTGGHSTALCQNCHTNGYAGTSPVCAGCHTQDYNESANPNHTAIGIGNDCATCHTLSPGWNPATFPTHNNYYVIAGAHVPIAEQCADCHNGNYNNTPNQCVGCHLTKYNQTTDPNHIAAQFPTTCADCHSQAAWVPATFDHDGQYFPIYSGKHQGEWNACADCHPNQSNYAEFTCTTSCHPQASTNNEHQGVSGYQYLSSACLACHPNGSAAGAFNHSTTFPLTGGHSNVDCATCHTNGYSGTSPVCASCHTPDYNQTANPNHTAIGISNDCAICHTLSPGWNPATFPTHNNYYVLQGAHAAIANQCADCHNGNYNSTPNTCVGCHQNNYNQTTNPNHASAQFPTTCADCHTQSTWTPSTFDHDGQYFPIYSGSHNNEWDLCSDCHPNASNYAEFTCTTACHPQSSTNNEHQGVGGYQYLSSACFSCHPTGNSAGAFNHNTSPFPLTGGHATATCESCHPNGYGNTSPECVSCHAPDYNQTANPNHVAIGIANDCATCHTTNPGWAPATFPTHSNYYVLEGAHVPLANQCANCHNGNYNSTPNTCAGCHTDNYTQTTNPNHASAQFPTTCADCHTQTAWTPSTFDHDGQYFPIYSGAHNNEWDLCADCHTNPSDYSVFTCTSACHAQTTTNNQHQNVGGYQYVSGSCFACHPTGTAAGTFNHSTSSFPLTGAHATTACASCHPNGYTGTPTECSGCHTPDYNQTTNPNHIAIGIANTCATCHTTNPGWAPATFPTHNNYYVLQGAHVAIANQCANCHNGNYNSTPNTCAGCHTDNYNQTTNPNHASAQFPTTCADCHTQTAWTPSTFDHDGQYFPIYSGQHDNEWDLCADCHTNPSDYSVFTCTTSCHSQSSTNNEHQGVGGYQYLSSACYACHPTGNASAAFNHNSSTVPLTGGHSNLACASCHPNGYTGAPTECSGCHTPDYNQTANPNHTAIGIANTCATCHTTNPGWAPATFPTHNNYYVLAGAHIPLANQCAGCHNGNYNSTPNTCAGCHTDTYNQTTNPNHATSGFSTACESCHSQTAWTPSTFNHSTIYPLTGAHASIATNCVLCHPTGYSNTPNTCEGCHQTNYNQATNPNHIALNISTTCATCHTTNPNWQPATFPTHNNYYVLAGAHVSATCAECHNGNYNNTPNTCSGCHMSDYNATNNPDHQSAQFPTTCADCHTQNSWNPSTFDHDAQYFPIYSGQHDNEWDLCSDCHPNSSNYTVFTCTTSCHPQNSTNNDHQGVSGYQYNSNACLNCHPDGSEGINKLDNSLFNTN